MSEYLQEKRINPRHVACAWALVVVMLAAMLVVTHLAAPACPPGQDAAADGCVGGFMREAAAERQP